jgi:two-component system sensor histidine kinase KdpD
LQRGWQSVETLVESALARLEGRLAEHPVEVALPANLPQVNVDAGLVTRVLVNLLENAVKHTPPGTHITISAGIEDGAVRVVVDDNGPGLPPGPPERLFAKFQRGRGDAETGAPGGAGLGLAICKAIIDAHGGYIAAMQRPGGGARFVFTVPTAEGLGGPA